MGVGIGDWVLVIGDELRVTGCGLFFFASFAPLREPFFNVSPKAHHNSMPFSGLGIEYFTKYLVFLIYILENTLVNLKCIR